MILTECLKQEIFIERLAQGIFRDSFHTRFTKFLAQGQLKTLLQ
jgi:hypothetical protein